MTNEAQPPIAEDVAAFLVDGCSARAVATLYGTDKTVIRHLAKQAGVVFDRMHPNNGRWVRIADADAETQARLLARLDQHKQDAARASQRTVATNQASKVAATSATTGATRQARPAREVTLTPDERTAIARLLANTHTVNTCVEGLNGTRSARIRYCAMRLGMTYNRIAGRWTKPDNNAASAVTTAPVPPTQPAPAAAALPPEQMAALPVKAEQDTPVVLPCEAAALDDVGARMPDPAQETAPGNVLMAEPVALSPDGWHDDPAVDGALLTETTELVRKAHRRREADQALIQQLEAEKAADAETIARQDQALEAARIRERELQTDADSWRLHRAAANRAKIEMSRTSLREANNGLRSALAS